MRKPSEFLVALLVTCTGFLGCGGSQSPPEGAAEAGSEPEPGAALSPSSSGDAAQRPELSAQACETSGGEIVGDIGDGAVHRPEYRCPGGAQPSGNIRAPEGGPTAVEGSVCCPR